MEDFNVKSELLFQEQDFVGHSGDPLTWKIECDALFPAEWKCIAKMIMEYEKRPFQAAVGIPRGGVELGKWLNEYSTQNPEDPYLICDDVLTTCESFEEINNSFSRANQILNGIDFKRNHLMDLNNYLINRRY